MEYVHLIGAEDVQRAGQQMAAAAAQIERSVGQFNEDVGRLQRIADDFLLRLLAARDEQQDNG